MRRLIIFVVVGHWMVGIPCAQAEPKAVQVTKAEQLIINHFELDTEPTVLRLWPKGSERNRSRNGRSEAAKRTDTLWVSNTESPSLVVFPPPADVKNTGVAMVFCPGGGYAKLWMDNPKGFTHWMNHLGVTVAVLKYHVPRSADDPEHQWPLADGQRAMRLLRNPAEALNISADKIGITGSSAGGHLATNLCINHADRAYQPIDHLDELSCRPDFALLYYPAYLTESNATMELGPVWPKQPIDQTQMPPVLITLNSDDRFAAGSLRTLLECKRGDVPCELHMWSEGGHGGLFNKYPLAEHARPAIRFLVRHGILSESLIAPSDAWLDDTVASLLDASKSPEKVVEPTVTVVPPSGIGEAELGKIDLDVRKRYGQSREVYRLWPGNGTRADDPLQKREETLSTRKSVVGSNVVAPTMTFFPAKNPDGRGVLVFPGGGYNVLAYQHEGVEVCQWLNNQGIHAFLIKYRTPRRKGLEKHAVALQDAQRSLRIVRSRAKEFGIRRDRIGVLGFSAGGHLCALATSPLDQPSYAHLDQHDQQSPIADFGILIYPAYCTVGDQALKIDPILVTKKKPTVPWFVASALDDKFTDGQLPLVFDRVKRKQSIAYHVYENGGHGKGLNDAASFAFGQWSRECRRWLADQER